MGFFQNIGAMPKNYKKALAKIDKQMLSKISEVDGEKILFFNSRKGGETYKACISVDTIHKSLLKFYTTYPNADEYMISSVKYEDRCYGRNVINDSLLAEVPHDGGIWMIFKNTKSGDWHTDVNVYLGKGLFDFFDPGQIRNAVLLYYREFIQKPQHYLNNS